MLSYALEMMKTVLDSGREDLQRALRHCAGPPAGAARPGRPVAGQHAPPAAPDRRHRLHARGPPAGSDRQHRHAPQPSDHFHELRELFMEIRSKFNDLHEH